ncbi:MAG: class II aldolase/adducin family protein [Methanobrevibacter sp.]|jgi:L-fuculose-phosphate aldolase|nr:class II aldolase/adducin family protein [Candidatus Methanovirga aequatorialis]
MDLVEDVLKVSKYIFERNLVLGKAGNVSGRRRENGEDLIAITPTLKSLNRLRQEDLVLTNIDGDVLTSGVPSSELETHLAIYREREDVNGIVHTHSPYATGFSFSNMNLKRLEGFGKIEREHIKKIPYKIPGSHELAKHASIAIKNEDVLILENHGVVAIGSTVEEAGDLAEFVEGTAKTQFISNLLETRNLGV